MPHTNIRLVGFLFVAALFCVSSVHAGKIYKCKTVDGRTTFSQTRCTSKQPIERPTAEKPFVADYSKFDVKMQPREQIAEQRSFSEKQLSRQNVTASEKPKSTRFVPDNSKRVDHKMPSKSQGGLFAALSGQAAQCAQYKKVLADVGDSVNNGPYAGMMDSIKSQVKAMCGGQ